MRADTRLDLILLTCCWPATVELIEEEFPGAPICRSLPKKITSPFRNASLFESNIGKPIFAKE